MNSLAIGFLMICACSGRWGIWDPSMASNGGTLVLTTRACVLTTPVREWTSLPRSESLYDISLRTLACSGVVNCCGAG